METTINEIKKLLSENVTFRKEFEANPQKTLDNWNLSISLDKLPSADEIPLYQEILRKYDSNTLNKKKYKSFFLGNLQ